MEQIDLLRHVLNALERLKIPYAVVGSFASGIWGESRFTQDIDVVIQVDPRAVRSLCQAFPASDFYVSQAAALDAVKHSSQFNVIHPSSGNKIDFMIAGPSSWSAAQIARRKQVRILPDLVGAVAAPEDVILGKLLYYREGGSEKHLRDIAGILRISGELIDRNYLQIHADKLKVADIWQRVLDEHGMK